MFTSPSLWWKETQKIIFSIFPYCFNLYWNSEHIKMSFSYNVSIPWLLARIDFSYASVGSSSNDSLWDQLGCWLNIELLCACEERNCLHTYTCNKLFEKWEKNEWLWKIRSFHKYNINFHTLHSSTCAFVWMHYFLTTFINCLKFTSELGLEIEKIITSPMKPNVGIFFFFWKEN